MIKSNLKNYQIYKSNRNIIICTSELFFPFTISLIEKFKRSSTVITQSQRIFKFLVKFYPKLDIIFFENERQSINKNPLKMTKNIYFNYKLKKKIELFLIEYSNCNVFTDIKAFSPLAAFSLIILSYKNKIYRKEIVKVFWKKTKPTLKIFLYKIYLKIFYSLDCDVVGSNTYIHLAYSKKYFNKIDARNMKYKINTNLIKNFCEKKLNIHSTKILLLSSGEALKYEHVRIEKKLYDDLFKKLRLTPIFNKMSLKRKNFKHKTHAEKNLAEVPAQFPANLIIHKFKIVIGIDSAALFEASNNGCKAISLIDLLIKDFFYVKHVKDYLNGNLQKNKKILFPKTFEQFIEYCM
jgi:hypothetical protein